MDKGKVVPYVEGAYQALLGCKSPQGVKEWHKSQRRKLGVQKNWVIRNIILGLRVLKIRR